MKTCAKCGGQLREKGDAPFTGLEGCGHKDGCPDGLVCRHDSLRRSCPTCEAETDRDAMKALAEAALAKSAGLEEELARARERMKAAEVDAGLQGLAARKAEEELARVKAEAERLREALEKYDNRAMLAWNAIRAEIRDRKWITEGRGMYQYDDDRYRQETGHAFAAIIVQVEAAIKESAALAALADKKPPTPTSIGQLARATLSAAKPAETKEAPRGT